MRVVVAAIAAICAFAAGYLAAKSNANSHPGDDPLTGLAPILTDIYPVLVGSLCAAGVFIGVWWLQQGTPSELPKVTPLDLNDIPAPEPSVVLQKNMGPTVQQ